MRTQLVLGSLLIPMMLAAGVQAQERRSGPRVEVRRVTPGDTKVFINGEDVSDRLHEVFQRRARLGVTVNLIPTPTDSVGAEIVAVTPGGPAAKVGIRSGDIITRLNGDRIVVAGARSRDGDSAPGTRLIELAAKLDPNDTVSVEYQRSGRLTTVHLVTADEQVFEFGPNVFSFRVPEGNERRWTIPELRSERFTPETLDRMRRLEEGLEGGRFEVQRFIGGPFASLELTSLNPDLAAYFGTTEGVLVLNAPADSPLGLKGGDVVLSIDGRRTTSPGSLTRILRSYEPGDPFKLDIMRLKKRETITGRQNVGVRERR